MKYIVGIFFIVLFILVIIDEYGMVLPASSYN